jgi:hypothetical protein
METLQAPNPMSPKPMEACHTPVETEQYSRRCKRGWSVVCTTVKNGIAFAIGEYGNHFLA